jgi:hypothetical protein
MDVLGFKKKILVSYIFKKYFKLLHLAQSARNSNFEMPPKFGISPSFSEIYNGAEIIILSVESVRRDLEKAYTFLPLYITF